MMMNDYIKILLVIGMIMILILNITIYFKIDSTGNRIKKNERGEIKNMMTNNSHEKNDSDKRISDLNELRKLKQYISDMKGNLDYVPYMLKTLESEISIQEHMLFTQLGKEVYKAEQS